MSKKEFDSTEIELEILELEEKKDRTRNIAEKAECVDLIKLKKLKLEKMAKKEKEKTVIDQKSNATRLDHTDSKQATRGDIVNTGNTFTCAF